MAQLPPRVLYYLGRVRKLELFLTYKQLLGSYFSCVLGNQKE